MNHEIIMFPLHHPECEVILYDYMQAMCWWIYLYYIYYHALQSCVCIVPLYYSECTKGLYTDDTVYIKIMGDIKKWWSVILPQSWRMTENHQSRVVPRFTTWIGGSHPTLEQICQIGWNDSQVVLAFDWRFQYLCDP